MEDLLLAFMRSLAPFDQSDFEKAFPYFTIVELKKDDYFCKAGRYSDRLGFVFSGLLRSFYILNDKDTTTFFLTPNTVAVALLSFLQNKPAIESIQALQPSTVITLKRKDLETLYHENWKWQQAGRVLVENYYIKMEQRSISLQSQSAHKRYEEFVIEYPEIIKYVPLHFIASFLGISPETLSRIRKIK